MSLEKDLFGKEVKSVAPPPVLPGTIEEIDPDKTGGRPMVVIAVPEEYAGSVTSFISERESAQQNLL